MRFVHAAGAAFSPLDEELGLLPSRAAPGLSVLMARLGQELPFARAAALLQEISGVKVSASAVRRATLATGRAAKGVEDAAVAVMEIEPPEAVQGDTPHQVSVDGAMIRLVGGSFAEVRTAVIGVLEAKGSGQAMKATNLTYFSRLTGHEAFSRLATIEVCRRGTENGRMVVTVNDGAEWIQLFIDLHFPGAIRILDWAHASGYLHEAGHIVDGECSTTCASLRAELLEGSPEVALERLAALRDALDPASEGWQMIARTLGYLEKRREQIRYAEFRQAGYPIGSGIAESGNKTNVQDRLKGAGMQWLADNANDILVLRSASGSGRWEATTTVALDALRVCHKEKRAERRNRRRARAAAAAVAAAPTASKPDREPYFENGRPTAAHPYNRFPAVRPRASRR